MSDISRKLRATVIQRANNRCEYCGLSQAGQEATFHIDHVVPRSAGGPTTTENLALACVSCSLRKESRQSAIDTELGEEAALFNPRLQNWNDHFSWVGERVVPKTSVGRATVSALALNRGLILAIQAEEIVRQRHPPT